LSAHLVEETVGIIDWDFDANARVAADNRVIHIVIVFDVADDMKGVGVLQAIEKFAAFPSPIGVEHDGVDLPDVGIDAQTEKDHLQKRNDQGKKERSKIAADVQNLLVEDRAETAKGVKHAEPPGGLAAYR
jgi:hypothetical protein